MHGTVGSLVSDVVKMKAIRTRFCLRCLSLAFEGVD